MKRCVLALALSVPIAIVPFMASAAEVVPYTSQTFAAAQKAGDPILVEITASWCPTCKAQKPILSKLESDPKFKELKVFDVDFDSQTDVVRQFKATMQSTLITFKGDRETGRSVGDTNADSIGALLEKAI
jgi:thioredoxin 1